MSTMPQQGPIHGLFVLGLACTGLVMGLLTSYVGLSETTEFWLWITAYVGWIVAAVIVDSKYPILDIILGSLATGLVVATVQTVLYDRYFEHNFDQYPDLPVKEEFAGAVYPFALAMGLGFGVVVGAIAEAIVRIRRKQNQTGAS